MAAGNSSRMGRAKQLLKWGNSTLIETCIKKVLQLNTTQTIVVLGANDGEIAPKINSHPIEIIHNADWSKGLGNSIAFGVKYIQNKYKVDGALIVLVDQPLIPTEFLDEIVSSFNKGNKQIIATHYTKGKVGVPVLFDKHYFDELSLLDGDKGAKVILIQYESQIKLIKGNDLLTDVDTQKDYDLLFKTIHQ